MCACVETAEIVLPRRWPLGEELAERKTARSLRTPAELAQGRANLRETDWGRAELRHTVARTAGWVAMSDEALWRLVLPTTVPRRHYVNQLKGCPVHGTEIKKRNHFHPWHIDPVNRPWKIQCPVGKEWYPSNDFANGDLAGGDFPDDGFGYVAPDGEHYYFLAEYSELVHLGWVRAAVSLLARSYELTGEHRYAHKAAIMLFRLAEEYGHMAYALDDRARCDCGYPRVRPRDPLTRPNGNGWVGFFTDRIWENANCVIFPTAYDQIFDGLEGDAELLKFLRCQREKVAESSLAKVYAHLERYPVPSGIAGYRRFVEDHMLRVMAQGLIDRAILGNDGMHQEAMITLALVLNYERGRELVDWTYTGPGQMQFHLPNYFFKDGSAYESIGGYNSIHIRGLNAVAMKMERLRALRPELYPVPEYPKITDAPKHRLLFDFAVDHVLCGRYRPQVGDTGGPATASRGKPMWAGDLGRADFDSAFRLYGDAKYAKVLYAGRGDIPHPELFAEPVDERVKALVEEHGAEIEHETDVLDGYGLAILRSGAAEARRALWLFYGQLRGHAHDHFLHIGLVAHGMDLMRCLGYPRSWHYSRMWEKHWATHYKVGVVGQQARFKGAVRAIAALPGFQYVDIEGLPYREDRRAGFARYRTEPGSVYRRACAVVDLSPTEFYVVDVFTVVGGKEHYWSFQGMGDAEIQGVELAEQTDGTLAGPDVRYGETRKVRGREREAFALLENVRRGRPAAAWGVDWAIGDNRDTHLKFTMVEPRDVEAIVTTGRSPSGGQPYEHDFVFARRMGGAPLSSRFVSVIEAYTQRPSIDRIEAVDSGVKVYAGELVDTILLGEGNSDFTFDGEIGLWRERRGKVASVTLINGSVLKKDAVGVESSQPMSAGEIVAVDRARNAITVQGLAVGGLEVGGFVMVRSADRGSCYRVRAIERGGREGAVFVLNNDPLIGEGDATGFANGVVKSSTHFPLANHRYYQGARLASPDGKREFGVASVTRGNVYLDPPNVPAAELRAAFGDGMRFRIYDYGVGDEVRVTTCTQLTRTR